MKKLIIVCILASILGCNPLPKADQAPRAITVDSATLAITPVSLETKKKVTIKSLDLTDANVTFLTSEVNSESVNNVLNDFQRFNDLNDDPIYLVLDSPGGNVVDGSRIISAEQTSKNRIIAIDTGLCASMCFMILEHATERLAVPRAILMAHPASIGMIVQGELDKAVSRLSFFKRFVDKMDYYIAARAGVSYESFKLKSNNEFWMDSFDALDQHYLDGIVSVRLPTKSLFGLGQNKLKEDIRME